MASSWLGKMASMKKQTRELDSTLFNPKHSNTTWLQQNLEEMEQNVKRIVKSIQDDANSIGKKSRPASISLVQKCHQMYLSLADRYIQETRVGVRSNILSNHYSHVSTTVVNSARQSLPANPAGSKQLKRTISTKCCKSYHIEGPLLAEFNELTRRCDDYSDAESDVEGQGWDENDIVEMEFVPLNHEIMIEEQESSDLEFRRVKLDSLSDNSKKDVSAKEKLELLILKLWKEDEIVAGETEIENSKISILKERVKELTEALEAAIQMYHNHDQLIGRNYELERLVSYNVSEINRMKKDMLKLRLENADLTAEIENALKMKEEMRIAVETERRKRFGILTGITVAGISFFCTLRRT